jgi:hypothetical protein
MTDTTTTAPSREAIKQELEATKAGFHQLLDSLSDADFKKKSGNPQWTNGQLLWHLGWGLSYVPEGVRRCRAGKNLNLPRGLFNVINPWITRWGSRGLTAEKAGQKYDEANAQVLAVLETVKDDEWTRSCRMAGNAVTIESEFRVPAEHFAEHKADILKSVGR